MHTTFLCHRRLKDEGQKHEDDAAIDACKDIIEHNTETSMDIIVKPAATKRFHNIHDTEQNESQEGIVPLARCGDGKECYPHADGLVDDDLRWVFAPRQFQTVYRFEAYQREDDAQGHRYGRNNEVVIYAVSIAHPYQHTDGSTRCPWSPGPESGSESRSEDYIPPSWWYWFSGFPTLFFHRICFYSF